MQEFDNLIEEWAHGRRETGSTIEDFTPAVMDRVREGRVRRIGRPAPPLQPLPAPLLAGLCLCLGMAKLALLFHFTF